MKDIEICFEIRIVSDKKEDNVVSRYEFIRPEKVKGLMDSNELLSDFLVELIKRTEE